MESFWHIVKWAWAAVFLVCFVVQMLALREFYGERGSWSHKVVAATCIFSLLPGLIWDIFGSREASRISMLVGVVAAASATVFLARMLRSRKRVGSDGSEVSSQGTI
jgi:cytochrome b